MADAAEVLAAGEAQAASSPADARTRAAVAIHGIPPSSWWFLHDPDRHTVTEVWNPIYTERILLKLGFQAVTTTIPYVWTPSTTA